MINEHGLAVEVVVAGIEYGPSDGGADGGACGGGDVDAAVGLARLAVEDAARAEGAVSTPLSGVLNATSTCSAGLQWRRSVWMRVSSRSMRWSCFGVGVTTCRFFRVMRWVG
ncbi:MAG: hypothetical protein ACYC18_10235 [Gammaproteobacteria bacterium]|nr:hypothetical protein [Gammaproteobacteria bacterium]